MKTFAEMTINRPPETAWAAVLDFAGRAKHSPRVKEATVVEGGNLSVGKHLRLQIDNNRFTLTVDELDAPSSLLLTMHGPLFRGGHHYTVFEHDGGSVVRIDADYGGPLGAIFGTLTKGKVQRDLTDELDAISKQAAATEA